MMSRKACAIAVIVVVGLFLAVACKPKDTTAPTVKIVTPVRGDSVTVATQATVKVYAKDDVANNIAKVLLYVGSTLKDSTTTVTNDTASLKYTPAAADTPTVVLKASATDKSDNKTDSDTLTVKVKQP
jgi:hypothetical protein